VRLIVDNWGDLVGCAFVEFASANEAKKAVQEKKGAGISVNMAEIARPYPFQPKYKLYKLAEKFWFKDNIRRRRLGLKTTRTLKKMETVFSREKITFPDSDDYAS